MKKYLNIKTLCAITSAAVAIATLTVGNISAFLGWFWLTIYAIKDMYREEVA